MNEQFETSLSGRKRAMSRFHAQELIFDYVEDNLDPDRRRAMEEYLPTCRRTQEALVAVRTASQYSARMARIEVSPEIIQQVQETKLGWSKWAERLSWRNWPEVARWSAEAVLIAATFATLISLLPLHKIARWMPKPAQELVLAEVDKARDDLMVNDPAESMKEVPPPTSPSAAPQVLPPSTSTPIPAAATLPQPSAPPAKPVAEVPAPPTAKIPPSNPTPAEVHDPDPGALQKPGAKTEAVAGEENRDIQDGEKGPRGLVYRAYMATGQIVETTDAVRDLILRLDGDRAGQVELGWRKSTGTYFHFTLPESNYESLLAGLRAYSPVRIYKDPHWRVMPEGQIRLILFVEDQSLKK